MAGAQNLRQVDAGNRARTSPVIEQSLAECILPHTLSDNSLNFGIEGWDPCELLFDFFNKDDCGLIRQG